MCPTLAWYAQYASPCVSTRCALRYMTPCPCSNIRLLSLIRRKKDTLPLDAEIMDRRWSDPELVNSADLSSLTRHVGHYLPALSQLHLAKASTTSPSFHPPHNMAASAELLSKKRLLRMTVAHYKQPHVSDEDFHRWVTQKHAVPVARLHAKNGIEGFNIVCIPRGTSLGRNFDF
jgi:hypothetical protein